MAITRRILDGAKDSWARLTSMVIVDDEPLSHVEPAALHAELEARKAARKPGAAPATAARMATSSPAARAERTRAAAARTSRIHGERDRKAATDRSAADDAFARMKAEAGRPGASSSGPRPGASSSSSGGARPARPGSPAAQVADWYKTLGVEPGTDAATIKAAYRKLMRKYHPDVHAGDPSKLKAATELSMRVTTAYNGLTAHLDKK